MIEATVPERALAVFAHPDDPEVGCGGTLARWTAAGSEVHLVIANRGDKGSDDPATDPDRLADERAVEVARAADVLGLASVELLGVDDGELENDAALRTRLIEVIRRIRPAALVAPDPTAVFFGDSYVNHRDHRITGWATLDAVSPAAGNPHYFPELRADGLEVHQVRAVYLSGTLEPNCWIDIASTLERKIDALYCHASQLGDTGDWFREFMRERAEDAGAAANVKFAEPFRKLTFRS